MQARLSSWNGEALNVAGSLTLIQSVNCCLPIDAMQTAKLPSTIYDKLNKLYRDFLKTEQKKEDSFD